MKSSICGLLGIEFPLLAFPIRYRSHEVSAAH